MPPVTIEVANVIALTTTHIEPHVVQDIKDSLVVPNREKIIAVDQHVYGADKMADTIKLYNQINADTLLLPRGYFIRLHGGLKQMGYEVELVDSMVDKKLDWWDDFSGPNLRDYQAEAVERLAFAAQGIYQSPTGSGKTVSMLALAKKLGQRTLIIVSKKDIVEQWRIRAKDHLGVTDAGFIGDAKWDEAPLTIAMQQTLWARRDELDDWWGKWGMVVLDECHAVQAETYSQVIEKFPSKFRYGVSATPRKTGNFKISESVLGPVVHKTEKKPLREAGYLITPRAFVVPTEFHHVYHGNQIGPKGGLKKRNNWQDVVEALTLDAQRNQLIADTALKLSGRTILILSKRLKHLEQLRLLLEPRSKVLMLTGAEKLEERMKVYDEAALGNCIILSTLADEAVDIPRIDTLFLCFPTKNTDLIIQQIGRGERPHPHKKEFIIIDFVDYAIGPMASQYRARSRMVYKAEDINVRRLVLPFSADKILDEQQE